MRTRPRQTRSPHRARQLTAWALQMRGAPTSSEARLWEALRGRQLGMEFRRQVVIGECIVDLVAAEARLVVEVDGGWHAGRERVDARRDRALECAGWRVVRLEAALVLGELHVAVERIRAALVVPP